MKKLNENKPLVGGQKLTREQMKKVIGGNVEPGGDYSCSVTCKEGYFACCNPGSSVGMPTCKCYKDGTSTTCKDGGASEV